MTTSKPNDWLTTGQALTITNPVVVANTSLYSRSLYDNAFTSVDTYNGDGSIDDVTGRQILETIQKGIYKTLVGRRDDAKAIWEEEDDDASYGEYKALKDTVELLEAFLREAPKARYSVRRGDGYDRYDQYGRRY